MFTYFKKPDTRTMEDLIVETEFGKLRGRKDVDEYAKTYYSFLGIPYAEPPTGKLRFKSPQPPTKWTGIRDATEEGSECYSFDTLLGGSRGTEDCLFLNVFSPQLPSPEVPPKAVMVFIHGGGYSSGSSKTYMYGPEFLVAEDVVLVTFNYRLGALGFLRLHDPELGVPGNAGLKDMVLALKWVQENISRFGGDPSNVTIFGESAGASSVHYLILSPMAKGLFHKAIMQSGCALNVWTIGNGKADDLARLLGLDTDDEKRILEWLQSVSVEELVSAQNKLNDNFNASRCRYYAPVVEENSREEKFLPATPCQILKSGKYNKVPMIIGYNNNEGLLAATARGRPRMIRDLERAVDFRLKVAKGSPLSKDLSNRIRSFYYGDIQPSMDNIDIYYKLIGHLFFVFGILKSVKTHLDGVDTPIFVYKMELDTELNVYKKASGLKKSGVGHADELGYIFKSALTPDLLKGSPEEMYVKRFTRMWTNFAKCGNPSIVWATDLPNTLWQRATKNQLCYLKIDHETSMCTNPEPEMYGFWEEIYSVNPVCKL